VTGELGGRGRHLLADLGSRIEGEAEVYEKQGRSRRFELGPLGESFEQAAESGWAVRAGDGRRSFFAAGCGEAPESLEPPAATAAPLRLPSPHRAAPRVEPDGLDSPLASEGEGRSLLLGIGRELEQELGDGRLVAARLDDGVSESALISSLGVEVLGRARSAALRLVARRGRTTIDAEFVARSPSGFKPLAIARRLADRLTACDGGRQETSRARQDDRLLISGPVAARLLEAFSPQLVGAGSSSARRVAEDGQRRMAAPVVTVVDDGTAGLLGARHDGAGVPTGRVRLIAEGELVAPLLAWWEAGEGGEPVGCSRRAGWRDVPQRGPTEMTIGPAAGVAVADLLADVRAGAYLIAAEGGVRLERDGDRFSLPVSGYAIDHGRATSPLGTCRLHGSLTAWLEGVVALARDLSIVPGTALYGAPTMLVEGLELTTGTARAA
jgi:predicted Zn-dependent protease